MTDLYYTAFERVGDGSVLLEGKIDADKDMYKIFEVFQSHMHPHLLTDRPGKVSCSYELIGGYCPFKEFKGVIEEKTTFFSVTQKSDFIYYFEFLGSWYTWKSLVKALEVYHEFDKEIINL